MDIYIKLFEVLFPVFFVVGIGYYLGKKNPKIDTTFITNFAANVGTPAMIIYALNPVNISFNIFINYFWYYALAIAGFMITGIIILYLLNTKDIIRELPPLTMPNTGNMGLPICLFAYGSQGLGVAAAISALIILCHFTLGVFLADRKFNFKVMDGDSINIGSKPNLVTILGGVSNPGNYQYTKGYRLDDYVKLAGGFTDDADVYGTVGANISFHDRDAGWSVTKGDYYVINCQNLNCNTGFHVFELVDTGSNTVLGELRLPVIDN